MRRSLQPSLEMFEGKALLSGIITSTTPGLAESVSGVATRSLSGAQVVMTLTETNISNHNVSVAVGESRDAFHVTQGSKSIWYQYAGQMIPQNLELRLLKPGDALSLETTWDGRAVGVSANYPWIEGPPLSGTFTVSNDADQRVATATVTIPKAWTMPVKRTHVNPPHPVIMVHAFGTIAHPASDGSGGPDSSPFSS